MNIKKLFRYTGEFNQIQFKSMKGLFTSIKGHICLTKGNLDYPGGQVEVQSPLTGNCFGDFWFKSRKSFFSKRTLFNEASNPQTLYLSKIGLVLCMIYYPSHEIFRCQKLPHAFQTLWTVIEASGRSNSSLLHLCKTQNS